MKNWEMPTSALKEVHTKCYKKLNCTEMCELLYVALKTNEHESRILRYFNSEDKEKRTDIKLISGEICESHVVILLDGNILDPFLSETMTKEQYDLIINTKNQEHEVIPIDYTEKYKPKSSNSLEERTKQFKLSNVFTEAITKAIAEGWLEKN